MKSSAFQPKAWFVRPICLPPDPNPLEYPIRVSNQCDSRHSIASSPPAAKAEEPTISRAKHRKPTSQQHYPETQNEKGLQPLDCKPLCLLVRPERFERPTPWFVAKYSIQLSYGRLAVFEREIIPSRLAALKHYLTIGSA